MNIEQMLRDTGAISTLARELGVDEATARSGAEALLPSVLSGFQQPAAPSQPQAFGSMAGGLGASLGGLGGLLGTIGQLGGGGLLDNVQSSEPTQVDKGNAILGQIFGSKDGSREVASQASAQSGVEPGLLKKMLPILAMIVAGYVMKQGGRSGGGGGLGGALGSILGGQSPAGLSSGTADILGQLIGAAGKYLAR